MKNFILSLAAACVAVIGVTNQTFAQQNTTRVGIKAGFDLMTLGAATSNGISINYGYRPGFQAGIYTETPLSNNVSFSSQLLYTQKGGNVKTNISGVDIDVKTQVNYFDVPLLFGFKVQSNLTFFAGPQVSFLLSQKTTAIVTGSASQSSTGTDGLRKTLIGGNLGAGYSISNNVGFNLNYLFDLQHSAESSADTGERSSGFVLSVSYLF